MYRAPGGQNSDARVPSPVYGEGHGSVAGMLGKMGMGLLTFELTRLAASPWMRMANVGIGMAVQRYASGGLRNAAVRSAQRGIGASPGIGKAVAERAFRTITGTRGPAVTGASNYATLSGMITTSRAVEKFVNTAGLGRHLGAYSSYKAAQTSGTHSLRSIAKARGVIQGTRGFVTGNRPDGSRIPGAGSFIERVIGRQLKDLKHAYLPTLPAFYVADKAIGFLPGNRHHDAAPQWWNPLSVGADFAKFAGGFYPIHLMFGGAMKVAQLGGAATKTGIHKHFSSEGTGRNFLESLIHGSQEMIAIGSKLRTSKAADFGKRVVSSALAGARALHRSDATVSGMALKGNRKMALKNAAVSTHRAFMDAWQGRSRLRKAIDPIPDEVKGTPLAEILPDIRKSLEMKGWIGEEVAAYGLGDEAGGHLY